ncbi:hypothetical protein JHK87_016461 [Glycine soja]|nr:hypothetical protein JHK87_016461 [Glycine soja]
MVSDVYVGGDTSLRVNSKMYTKLDSCLVIPPTPNRAKPRAIVKFLGGAFIGDVWKMMLDAVRSTLQEIDQEILNSLTKFVDQLPSVMNEVTTYSLLVEAMVEAVSKAVVVHVKLNLYEFRGFLRNTVEELEQKMRFDDSRLAHQGR